MNTSIARRIVRCTCALTWALTCFEGDLLGQVRLGDSNLAPPTSGWGSNTWEGTRWVGGTETQQWTLGVRGENTTLGVVIRDVTPSSAAARARIEPGDRIVNVSGVQVGSVDARVYDLQEEINRRADSYGIVSLLLQDHNNGRLANIRVQLDAYKESLSGNLNYSGITSMPRDALITVQLENVTRPHFAPRNGIVSFPASGSRSDSFEIPYDANYIYSQDVYQLRAFVVSGGRTILESSNSPRVLTQGNPSTTNIQLAPSRTMLPSQPSGNLVAAGYGNYDEFDSQVNSVYRQILGRNASNGEIAAWRNLPNRTERISRLHLELMASQEYYDAAGNNNQAWIASVFRALAGKQPSSEEVQGWLNRYVELRESRSELLNQLSTQIARANQR
ncbi:MAG: YbaY family lipoprotein [Planctomycetales bacterium]|nr:YbaY family lipoprotein [Planctomycetales bacterium]